MLRRDGSLGFAEENVADVGIVVAIVGVGWRDVALGGCAVFRDECERTRIFLQFGWCGRFFPREAARAELGLLDVEGVFDVRAARAVKHEARASGGGEHSGAKDGSQTGVVVKSDVERVVGDGVIALDANVSRNGLREAEEKKSVIDQVRSEVEEDAAAWAGAFAPGVGL